MPTIQVATGSGTLALHTRSILAIRVAHFNGGIARSPDTSCEALAPRAYFSDAWAIQKNPARSGRSNGRTGAGACILKTTFVEQAK